MICRIQKMQKFRHLQSLVRLVLLQQIRCRTLTIWRKDWHE